MLRGLMDAIPPLEYRIRTLRELDDRHLERLRSFLEPYGLEWIREPRWTPILSQIDDFPHVRNRQVFMVDFAVRTPLVTEIVRRDIAAMWEVPESDVIVRMREEPRETARQEAEQRTAARAAAEKEGLVHTNLGDKGRDTAHESDAADELYGNAANQSFLRNLAAFRRQLPDFGMGEDGGVPYPREFYYRKPEDLRAGVKDAYTKNYWNAGRDDTVHPVPPELANDEGTERPRSISRWGNVWASPRRDIYRDREGRKYVAIVDPASDRPQFEARKEPAEPTAWKGGNR